MAKQDLAVILCPWTGCIIQSVSSTEKNSSFMRDFKKYSSLKYMSVFESLLNWYWRQKHLEENYTKNSTKKLTKCNNLRTKHGKLFSLDLHV